MGFAKACIEEANTILYSFKKTSNMAFKKKPLKFSAYLLNMNSEEILIQINQCNGTHFEFWSESAL